MKLSVLTYNIHRAIGLDRRFRLDRVISILEDHDADVVLLQEVDEGAPRSQQLNLADELAQALAYPHYALGHNVSLKKGRYGNATLSRYPITRERNIDLTIGERKRRGCQHTTIAVPGRDSETSLEVFNVHLGLSARERQRQAGRLIRSPEMRELDPRTACILGGDFNDGRSQLQALFEEALGFHNATDRHTRNGWQPIRTFPSISPMRPLDRIYYKGGLHLETVYRCRHQLSRVASDHLPVIARFDWR